MLRWTAMQRKEMRKTENELCDSGVDVSNTKLVRYKEMNEFVNAFDNYRAKYGSLIGQGTFGRVYKTTWSGNDSRDAVVKEVIPVHPRDIPQVQELEEQNNHIEAVRVAQNVHYTTVTTMHVEASIHGLLAHENIVQMYAYCHPTEFNNAYNIPESTPVAANAYEYVSGGDLFSLLNLDKSAKTDTYVPLLDRLRIIYDIAVALKYLHYEVPYCMILHRDIKPENIFVTRKYNDRSRTVELRGMLGDFGFATIIPLDVNRIRARYKTPEYNNIGNLVHERALLYKESPFQLSGTYEYRAPELGNYDDFGVRIRETPASDVYALGVTLRKVIFGPSNIRPGKESLTQGMINNILLSVHNIIKDCTRKYPQDRIDTQGLVIALENAIRRAHGITAYNEHKLASNVINSVNPNFWHPDYAANQDSRNRKPRDNHDNDNNDDDENVPGAKSKRPLSNASSRHGGIKWWKGAPDVDSQSTSNRSDSDTGSVIAKRDKHKRQDSIVSSTASSVGVPSPIRPARRPSIDWGHGEIETHAFADIGADTDSIGFNPQISHAVLVPCEHYVRTDAHGGLGVTPETKQYLTHCPYCLTQVKAIAFL